MYTRVFGVHSINRSCVEIPLNVSLINAVICQVPLQDSQSSILAFAELDAETRCGEDKKN